MAANPNTVETARVKKRGRRLRLAVALLVVLVITLIGSRLAQRATASNDSLHGDSEEAPGALETALAAMPTNAREQYLLRSITDPSPGLRYAAVDALSSYKSAESVAAIEGAFRDSSSTVRQRALETLHVVDHERGLLLLLAGLRDEDTWIRQAAITQLATPEPTAVTPVAAYAGTSGAPTLAASADRTPATASAERAARATSAVPAAMAASAGPLKRKGGSTAPHGRTLIADRRAVPMLIRALDDSDAVVDRYAVGLLAKLTGRGMTYRTSEGPAGKRRAIEDWKRWWAANAARYPAPPAFADVPPIRPTRSDPAPAFELHDTLDRTVRLSDQRGRVTLINFWGTWCPPCKVELPGLERLHERYGTRGLTVIGAAVGESNGSAGLRSWCAEHGLKYTQCLSTPELQEAYGKIEEVPVSVLIDKRGQVRYRWEGERDFSTFEAAVTRLLAE